MSRSKGYRTSSGNISLIYINKRDSKFRQNSGGGGGGNVEKEEKEEKEEGKGEKEEGEGKTHFT